MSIRVMTKVWECYSGGGSELLALLALADWSDDEGRCFPSISSIARKIRLKDRQAKRVVHHLISEGFVRVVGNEFGGAPGSSRQYRIALDRLTGVLHDTPKRETGVVHDRDGCLPRPERGVADDTLTVIEPSMNRQSARDAHLDTFSIFWARYPRRVARASALKAWQKIKPSPDLLQTILKGLDSAISSDQWSKDSGQYIPYPATWLNGRRWEDATGEESELENIFAGGV